MKYLFHFKAYFYRETYFIQVAKKSLAKESWRSGFTFWKTYDLPIATSSTPLILLDMMRDKFHYNIQPTSVNSLGPKLQKIKKKIILMYIHDI